METLKEGEYAIPEECVGTYFGRVFYVRKRGVAREPLPYHCEDCAYFRIGLKVVQSQRTPSPYCAARPKIINNRMGFFYATTRKHRVCDKFKQK